MPKVVAEDAGLPGKGGAGIVGAARGAFLDAVVLRIGHIDVATGVHRHAIGQVEVSVVTARLTGHADLGLVDPMAVVDHNTVVAVVHHKDVAVDWTDGERGRTVKFVVAGAGAAAEGSGVGAAGAENLDPVVGRIRHVNAPGRVYGGAALYPGPPVAEVGVVAAVHPGLPDRPLLDPRRVHFDQPEAPVLRHIDAAVGGHSDAPGFVQADSVRHIGHERLADGADIGAAAVELLDPMGHRVADVDVAGRIHRHVLRPHKVGVVRARLVGHPGKEGTCTGKVAFQDPVIRAVGDEEVAAPNGNPPGVLQVGEVVAGHTRHTEEGGACPGLRGAGVFGAALDPMVVRVHHIEPSAAVKGDPGGPVEPGVIRAGLAGHADGEHVDRSTAGDVVDLDAVVPTVRNEEPPGRVKGNAPGIIEVGIVIAALPGIDGGDGEQGVARWVKLLDRRMEDDPDVPGRVYRRIPGRGEIVTVVPGQAGMPEDEVVCPGSGEPEQTMPVNLRHVEPVAGVHEQAGGAVQVLTVRRIRLFGHAEGLPIAEGEPRLAQGDGGRDGGRRGRARRSGRGGGRDLIPTRRWSGREASAGREPFRPLGPLGTSNDSDKGQDDQSQEKGGCFHFSPR